MMMMTMMVLCPKAGSLAFTQAGDEMSEVVSRCLPQIVNYKVLKCYTTARFSGTSIFTSARENL